MNLKISPYFIPITFLLLIFSQVSCHEGCDYDSDRSMQELQQETARILKEQLQNKSQMDSIRSLQQAQTQPLRVTFDDSGLQTGITTGQRDYLVKITKTIVNYLKNLIKVIPNPANNVFSNGMSTMCLSEVTVPLNDRTTGIPNSDLHLYLIYANDSTKSYVANAGWCAFSQSSNFVRPSFGRIKFNISKITSIDQIQTRFQRDLMVTLHEVMHVLGFSGVSIPLWLDRATKQPYGDARVQAELIQTETVRGFQTNYLKSSNVLKIARKHYNCDNIIGMQMENQQGAGLSSHWERTIIYGEVMNPSTTAEGMILSYFTTALLKDTGYWDEVNENLTDPIYWGKDKGCDFQVSACLNTSYEEFVKDYTVKRCTFGGDAQGYGVYDNYSDNCTYLQTFNLCEDNTVANDPNIQPGYYKSILSDYQWNSKCFQSTLTHPDFPVNTKTDMRCHLYQCNNDESEITISFSYLSGFSVTCKLSEQGQQKSITYTNNKIIGTITCPSNFERYCENKNCQNFCSFNGVCIKGKCLCNPGYSGVDCSLQCPKYNSNGQCVDTCPPNTYANSDNTCQNTCSRGYYPDNGICQLCNFSCSRCTGPSANECTSCQFLTYLQGSTCVEICQTGYYKDESTKSCQQCPTGCQDCTNSTICGTCQTGYIKSGNICANTQCDPNCLNCTAIKTECTACQTGQYLFNKQCVNSTQCPPATFANSTNNTCTPCSKGCNNCTSSTKCNICDTVNGYRQIGDSCTLCQSPCSNCLDVDTSKCTACEGIKVLYNQQCYDTCPAGTYLGQNNICLSCIAGCSQCTNNSTCDKCNQAQNYKEFIKDNKQICITSSDCFSPCLTCNGTYQPTSCLTCAQGYLQQGSQCQTQCDSGYLQDANNICQSCSQNCKACSKTKDNCISCNSPQLLYLNKCQDSCPTSYQAINGVCSQVMQNTVEQKSYSYNLRFTYVIFILSIIILI